jgi:hypothetical protein
LRYTGLIPRLLFYCSNLKTVESYPLQYDYLSYKTPFCDGTEFSLIR